MRGATQAGDGGFHLPQPGLRARLDALSSRIKSPPRKLWFIQTTLHRFGELPESLRRLPVLRTVLFHYVALDSLGDLVWEQGERDSVDAPKAALWLFYRGRHVLLAVTLVALAFATYRLGTVGYRTASLGSDWLFSRLIPPPVVAAPASIDFHPSRVTAPPDNVWLVAHEGDEELWSNGLRVDTSFEIEGPPRSFLSFPRNGGEPVSLEGAPVGIVYHASQSDMAPLSREFNGDILDTTRSLLGWLQRRRIYNYLIDRFGRVSRIVNDDGVAVHAGKSIWADDDSFYLNLNESFIGVSFESRWDSGREVLTPAQVQAAVNLTDVLRARYGIPEERCVPHGLVSVNAGQRLIGFHADWAKGFPFHAFGLKDLYELPPPSMTEFGFWYDSDLESRLGGELWPGVALARDAIRSRAQGEGTTPRELRGELFERYERLLARQDGGP